MSQDFVVREVLADYPKSVVFTLFGAEKIAEADLHEGRYVRVNFDIDANEYNGKWYNKVNAYRVRQITEIDANRADVEDEGEPTATAPSVPVEEQRIISVPPTEKPAPRPASNPTDLFGSDSDSGLPF